MNSPPLAEGLSPKLCAAVIYLGAAVLSVNFVVAGLFAADCRQSNRWSAESVRPCWAEARRMAGIGDGGPLSVAALLGGFAWGYRTLNPALRRPENPDGGDA